MARAVATFFRVPCCVVLLRTYTCATRATGWLTHRCVASTNRDAADVTDLVVTCDRVPAVHVRRRSLRLDWSVEAFRNKRSREQNAAACSGIRADPVGDENRIKQNSRRGSLLVMKSAGRFAVRKDKLFLWHSLILSAVVISYSILLLLHSTYNVRHLFAVFARATEK